MAADGGGFDAEKFRKIVAMFDSPYDEERKTAFILALELLRKNELRFCDRLVDGAKSRKHRRNCSAFSRNSKRHVGGLRLWNGRTASGGK